jgi:hypothetical protein
MDSDISAVLFIFNIFILFVFAVIGVIQNSFRKQKYPNTRNYIWGYVIGYGGILWGLLFILGGIVNLINENKESEVGLMLFVMLWGGCFLVSGIGILMRRTWAWILRICIWPNPISLIINLIYFLNRKEEFKIERDGRYYNFVNEYHQPSQIQLDQQSIKTIRGIIGQPKNSEYTANFSNKKFKWYYLLWVIPIIWFPMYVGLILYWAVGGSVKKEEQTATHSMPLTWNPSPQTSIAPQVINAPSPTPTATPISIKEEKPILEEQYQPPVLDATDSNEKYNEPPESQLTYKEIHNQSLQNFFNNYLKVIASNNGLALNSYLGPTLTYTYSEDPSGRASKQTVITDHLNLIQKYPDRKYMNKKILSITPIFPAGTAITPEMRKYPPIVIIKYKFDYWYKGKEVKTGTATVDLTIEDTRFWVNYLPKYTNPLSIWTQEEVEFIHNNILIILNEGYLDPIWKITGYSEVVDRKL